MIADMKVLRGAETMVSRVEAQTDAAVEFIDAYTAEKMMVVDSGLIILRSDAMDEFIAAAERDGFTVEVEHGL